MTDQEKEENKSLDSIKQEENGLKLDSSKADIKTEIIGYDDWLATAKERFGDDPKQWKFKCSNCGNIQTVQDFIDIDISEPETKVFFSCIGRWKEGIPIGQIGDGISPCNYTLGGLFALGDFIIVIDKDGKEVKSFKFPTVKDLEKLNEKTNL